VVKVIPPRAPRASGPAWTAQSLLPGGGDLPLGGIAVLVYLFGRLIGGHTSLRPHLLDNTAVYWHFMGGLWLYLLFVISTRL